MGFSLGVFFANLNQSENNSDPNSQYKNSDLNSQYKNSDPNSQYKHSEINHEIIEENGREFTLDTLDIWDSGRESRHVRYETSVTEQFVKDALENE